MTDAERNRLAEVRRLIFTNLANGAPMANVMGAFRLSQRDVEKHFQFVARCITEYRFKRAMQYLRCDTVEYARANKRGLMPTLKNIGPIALTSDHKLSTVTTTSIGDAVRGGKIDEIVARQEGRL